MSANHRELCAHLAGPDQRLTIHHDVRSPRRVSFDVRMGCVDGEPFYEHECWRCGARIDGRDGADIDRRAAAHALDCAR